MEEREKSDEQVEDLEPAADDAENVMGGASKNEVAIESVKPAREASPQLGANRGGWDGNHSQTLIRI